MSDSPRRSSNKRGHNKGILAAKRARKRAEAEQRNACTPLERTRAYRRASQDDPAFARAGGI